LAIYREMSDSERRLLFAKSFYGSALLAAADR